jgi:hypothetical protein
MAGKKKQHGWEGSKKGQPPFPGAAPPIHTQQGGKFKKSKKDDPKKDEP